MIANYSRVRLLTDKYNAEGARQGDSGYVIEVYGNGDYEVEFADQDGIDYAQIVARAEELQVITEEPLPTFRDTTVMETTQVSVPSSVAGS